MAREPSIFDALVSVAEAVLGRDLTIDDRAKLGDHFADATGTTSERGAKALREFTGKSTEELEKYAKRWEGTANLSRMTFQWTVKGN